MNLADDSRIWIFQANRKFSTEEKDIIISKLKNFIADWNAHGAALLADFDLPYDQFIVVGVDENQASASGATLAGASPWENCTACNGIRPPLRT